MMVVCCIMPWVLHRHKKIFLPGYLYFAQAFNLAHEFLNQVHVCKTYLGTWLRILRSTSRGSFHRRRVGTGKGGCSVKRNSWLMVDWGSLFTPTYYSRQLIGRLTCIIFAITVFIIFFVVVFFCIYLHFTDCL